MPAPHAQHRSRKSGARPVPFTFICTACECVEHRRTPTLPAKWQTEEVSGDVYAYCGSCAIDLPRQEPVQ